MNAKKKSDPASDHKATIIKKNPVKAKKFVPAKFDKEGFFLAWGLGIVVAGIGVLIIWATKTAPTGASKSAAHSLSQRMVHLLPESAKETLAFILGGLFVLFGVFCLFLGLKIIFQYFRDKMRQ